MCHCSCSAGSATSTRRGTRGRSQGLAGNSASGCFPTFSGLSVLGGGQGWGWDGQEGARRDRGAARAGSGRTVPTDASWGGMSTSLQPGVPTDSHYQGVLRDTMPWPCLHRPIPHHSARPARAVGCWMWLGRLTGRRVAPRAASQAPRSCCRGRSRLGSSRISLGAASHLLYYFSI